MRDDLVIRITEVESRDDICTDTEFYMSLNALTCAVTETICSIVPKVTSAPYHKCWWTRELSEKHREVHRIVCRSYSRR